VRTYKAAVTTACRQGEHSEFAWQRNYYEHIVRNERELNANPTLYSKQPAPMGAGSVTIDKTHGGCRHPPPLAIIWPISPLRK